ncbi:MAG: fused MFS/spermidine synthase [Candidatus Eisenbacteria bacterium]
MKKHPVSHKIILLLFLLSGATGLIYEVAWTRLFTNIFGSTALAVSTVLAAFMAGLAIGSRVIGSLIDRRGEELRTYGILEIGIGVSAFLLLPALELSGRFFISIYRAFHPSFNEMSLVRFAFSFLLLLIPTVLMGGTLPVLVRFWVQGRRDIGRTVGNLYAINTFGAMVGCFIAGFWLLSQYGIRHTVLFTAIVNLGIGATALILGFGRERVSPAPDGPGEPPAESASPDGRADATDSRARLALFSIGASGFLALAYEVVWTRVLLYVLAATVYAFTVMLTTFLGGLALGSLVLAPRVDRLRSGFRLFGILEVLIGATALLSVVLLSQYHKIHNSLLMVLEVQSWEQLAAVKFIEAALVILVPTLLMGMTFPLVTTLYARDLRRIGRRVGNMVAVNTVGAVLGSFLAGFVLIPMLGTQNTIVVLALGNGVLGGVLLLQSGSFSGFRRVLLAVVPVIVLLVGSLFLPPRAFLPVFGINLPGGKIIYCEEGITGTVTIHESLKSRLLSINGADVAGTTPMLRTTQKLQAHIPLLLHPNPRKVMQVGLGSGETAHSILYHPIERLDGVDISPEVIEAGPYFEELNKDVYEDPRLHVIIEDAKSFVVYTEETYDLILNDSVHPIFRGSSDLYAKDYFLACRERLAPDGMMSSWFPIALLSETDLKMLLRTFQSVFPRCTVWIAPNCLTRNALLLGWKSGEPHTIDFGRIASRLAENRAVRDDLNEVGLGGVYELLDCYMLHPETVAKYAEKARINTYDRPHMEFSAPRVTASGDRSIWAVNLEALVSIRNSVLPRLTNLGETEEDRERVKQRMTRRHEASRHIVRGLVYELRRETGRAEAEYGRALDIYPDDPIAKSLVGQLHEGAFSFQSAIAAGTTDPRPYYQLGVTYLGQGRFAEAASLLEKALHLNPNQARAHLELARARLNVGDLAGARSSVDRALDLEPRAGGGYAVRAHLRWLEKDLAGAESDIEEALARGADLPWIYALLGKVLREAGRTEEAIRAYREALDGNPDLRDARIGLGEALIELGRVQEGLAELERAAEAHNAADLWIRLGRAQHSAGLVPEAEDTFTRSLASLREEEGETRASVLYDRARARLDLGQEADAVRDLEEALRIAPLFPEAEDARRLLRSTK